MATATSPSRRSSAPDTGIGHRLGARDHGKSLEPGVVIQELAYLMRSGRAGRDGPDGRLRLRRAGRAIAGSAAKTARMVTLSDGNYSHVPIDTLLHGKKIGRPSGAPLRQGQLSRPADARRGHADVPLLKDCERGGARGPEIPATREPCIARAGRLC